MKRLIEKYLDNWRGSPNRKPLILRGARQVGKTWVVDHLGKNAFKHYLKLNAEQDPGLRKIFSSNNPGLIINELSALFSIPIIENEILIFIDEVQTAPEVLAALRYFYEERPGLHIIAAGSLLDHTLGDMPYSMPVGRVEFAYLFPMNFIEFLMANGQEGLADYISAYEIEKPYGETLHQKLLEWLRLYFFIGGMPEAVKVYVETGQLAEVEKVHNSILTSFKYDFAKYATRRQQDHLNECMNYAAGNIGKKVKYSMINPGVKSTYLKEALLKLEMSRIVNLVRKTGSSKVPITQFVSNEVFKPLFLDTGLACRLSGIKLTDLKSLVTDFEGALAEQFIGQELLTTFAFYEDSKLYYWSREKKNANAEIDYLFQIENSIYPIEVKAGKTGTLKSLQVYLGEKNQDFGIRFNLDLPTMGRHLQAKINVNKQMVDVNFNLLSLPLYLVSQIKRLVGNLE